MSGRALITGASSGIGHAFARELAARGHDLVIVARSRHRLEEVAARLRADHRARIDVLTADLTNPDDLARVVDVVTATTDPVDLLINNAGASSAGWFGTTDVADEDRQLDLLVRAPMHLTDGALKTMSGRGHGQIINVTSVAAYTPRGSYSAHKSWLNNLSLWANRHYADAGITVMALCPGFVRTEFHQRMGADMSTVPRWMWLKADEVVRTALDDLDRGKALSIPSMRYKVLAHLARHLPPALVARVAKRGR